VIPQLLQYGEVRRPKLGASLPSVAELREQGYRMPVEEGLLVLQVVPNSPASAAGLKGLGTDGTINDIIVGADGTPVKSMDDLYRLLDRKQFGETVQLEVFRNGSRVSVPVKLTPLAASPRTRRATE
jgi:serine protease Do/serine protease DegQ